MAKTTFWDIIELTIEKIATPLSAKEIWDKANELGTIGNYTTTGKTPWATIAAYCYTDINNNGDGSMIIQTSERPAQFFLRKLVDKIDVQKVQKLKDNEAAKNEKVEKRKFNERDLHPLLVTYALGEVKDKMSGYTLTLLAFIFHSKTTKRKPSKYKAT
jgi:uncharacterized protein